MVARALKKNELAITSFCSSRSAMSPTPLDRGMLTATVPEPSPWNGWKREFRNHSAAMRSRATRPKKIRPRRTRARGALGEPASACPRVAGRRGCLGGGGGWGGGGGAIKGGGGVGGGGPGGGGAG